MPKFDYSEIVLERKEKCPELKTVVEAIILAKNSQGLFVDLNKSFEGYISTKELGLKKLEDFNVGEKIEVFVSGDQNADGIFRLSIREIENEKNWDKLEELKEQNLDLKITKLVKSGVEVEIPLTAQTGFIPTRYLDTVFGPLKDKKKEDWVGLNIPGRIHELDKTKNKIILNNRVISEEQRAAKAEETLTQLSLGQTIKGTVVRTTDFGVFVDIGGIDALIPGSELSWRRFKKPSDVVKIGQEIESKVFRIDIENKKVGLSVKQVQPDPWTTITQELSIGSRVKGKVATHAEFGVFVEVVPGVEALLHKTNFKDDRKPEIGEEVEAEVINIDPSKKRMGISNNIETKANAVEAEVAPTVEEKNEEEPAATAEEAKPTEAVAQS